MALPSLGLLVGALIFAASFWPSTGLISTPELNPPLPKSISDLKEAIVKGLGFHADDIKVSGFDTRDALVGQSVAYEFDVEIDNTVIPLKLLEDVNRWDYVDLPIFRTGDSLRPGNENGLVSKQKMRNGLPVLAPFQLAGPMELWIQDAKDMRIALPHDVDAGVLKKVILADGAIVTVKGARSVSLRHPLELPLPLNQSNDGFASGMLALAESLRHAARTQGSPLLSLRIVGPTSLTSPSYSNNKLKLKRLAPGLVELSPPSPASAIEDLPAVDLEEAPTLLTPRRFTTVWPLASINGSNSNLLGFEALLASVLGPRAKKEGRFKVSKAEVSAQTFLKMGFRVEKRVGEIEGFPGWRTKPETVRMEFEALARVEGERVVAEKIVQVNPVVVEDTVAPNMLVGNTTMSTSPIVNLPSDPFTL